jgi:hypothetical protein
MNHDQILEEQRKDQLKREEDARKAQIEKTFRIENKFCYCDLQKYFPYDCQICEFCYEKARQDMDQDMAADWADAQNKHNREQELHNPENVFFSLWSEE